MEWSRHMTRIESIYLIPFPCIDHEASRRDQAAVHVPLATHCTPQLYHEKGKCLSFIYRQYIPGIYQIYTIVDSIYKLYTRYRLTSTQHQNIFHTSDISNISLVYSRYMTSWWGTWLVPNKCIEVFVWYIPAMSPMLTYRRYISGIYQVNTYIYTNDIPDIYQRYIKYIYGYGIYFDVGLYLVYTWYILSTLVYIWYIPGIYCLYMNV